MQTGLLPANGSNAFAAFQRTRTWIFDLDNTLYPAECNLFAQVDQRMAGFIAGFLQIPPAEARRVQKDYYYRYGTTLAGLMANHGLEPEPFLEHVHDIDLAGIAEAPRLSAAIAALPGRKFVFTNGSRRHAERVAGKLGILHRFEDIFDIAAAGYTPKPSLEAYDKFLKFCGAKAEEAAMFEDLPHNLESPHALGMITVLVKSVYIDHPAQLAVAGWEKLPEHIHHMTGDLAVFLEGVFAAPAAGLSRQS